MKLISFALLGMAACSGKCLPKHTDQYIHDTSQYTYVTCLNSGFTPERCIAIVKEMEFVKRLENVEVIQACLQKKQL